MSLRTLTLTIATLGVGALCAPAAMAGSWFGWLQHDTTPSTVAQPTLTVSFADLDVSREAGARALLGRINQAAKSVCGPTPYIMDLGAQEAYRACVDKAVAQGVEASKAPLVATLYHNAVGMTASTGTPVSQQ